MSKAEPGPIVVAYNRVDFSILFLLGLPLLLAWWAFSEFGGFPSNDDPFYGRPAQIFADELRYQVVRQMGELSASSAAHVIIGGALAYFFGFSYRILFLAVLLQLWLASAAIYFTMRQAQCSRAISLFLSAIFLFNPLCFGHGFTFMTDAPAMCWGVLAVAAFIRGMWLSSLVWLLAGSVAVGVALWMRQTHVLLTLFPAFVLGWLRCRSELSVRQFSTQGCAAVLPAALAMLLFESGLIVFGDESRMHTVAPSALDWRQTLINTYGSMALLGFVCLPLLPLLVARLVKRHRPKQLMLRRELRAAFIIGILLVVPLLVSSGRACVTSATGTFIQNAHFGPIFLSDFQVAERWGDMGGVSWPNSVWLALTLASIINVSMLLAGFLSLLLHSFRRTRAGSLHHAISFGLCSAAVPVVLIILSIRTGVLDRYWMLLLPLVFGLIAQLVGAATQETLPVQHPNLKISTRTHHPITRSLALGLLFGQLGLSLVFVRDFLAWNQTRWLQVEAWLAEGLQAEDIDGGRDINAWLRSAEDYDTMPRTGDSSLWWNGFAKVALAIGPRDGWEETGRLKWQAWATGRHHEVLLLRRK